MAYEIPLFKPGVLLAGADLTERQYRFGDLNSSGEVVACGAGDNAIGVINNKPNVGEPVEIMVGGIAKVECGGAVTNGGPVASAANGIVTNATSGDFILGRALETGANGRIISVLLLPGGIEA